MNPAAPPAVQEMAKAMGVADRPLARRLLCRDDTCANEMTKIWGALLKNGQAKIVTKPIGGFDELPEYLRPDHTELDLSPSAIIDKTMIELMQLQAWDLPERVVKEVSPNERGCAALLAYTMITFDLSWSGGLLGDKDRHVATRVEATTFIDQVYGGEKERKLIVAALRRVANIEVGSKRDALLTCAEIFEKPRQAWQPKHLLDSPVIVGKSDRRRDSEERVKATLLAKAVQQIFGALPLERVVELANIAIEHDAGKPFTVYDIQNWTK